MLLKKLMNPIIFQGNINKNNYFEGWYYKQVSLDEKKVISFIPGINLSGEDSHCFIQYIFEYIDKNNKKINKSGYIKYSLNAFNFKNKPFSIQIENSTFSEKIINVNLSDNATDIYGSLKLEELTPINKNIFMPNIMGYFAYIPQMQCNHSIISMNHRLNGVIKINDEDIDFTNGKGYIEKDFGSSFPKEYVWLQCNNFKNKNTSIMFSLAQIPFINSCFNGFICNLCIDDNEYRFATYNNSKISIKKITVNSIIINIENKKAILNIEGSLEKLSELIAPQEGKMKKIIKEGLFGEVKISFYNKKTKITYKDFGCIAGIEIVN